MAKVKFVCPQCGAEYGGPGICVGCQVPVQTVYPTRGSASPITWSIGIAAAVFIVFAVVLVVAYFIEDSVSADQQEMLDALGPPAQFTVAYTPRLDGESQEIVRTEVWYYPDHEQKILFTEGAIIALDPMEYDGGEVKYPELLPTEFDLSMDLDAVSQVVGGEIEKIDEFADLEASDDAAVYVSDSGVVFAMERGRLVYIQTLGIEE